MNERIPLTTSHLSPQSSFPSPQYKFSGISSWSSDLRENNGHTTRTSTRSTWAFASLWSFSNDVLVVEDLFLKKRNAVCSLTTAQSMEPFDLDLLKEGSWSNVLFSLRRYSAEGYKFARTRTPQEIKSDVLSSRRVKHVIEKVWISWILFFIYAGEAYFRLQSQITTKQLCPNCPMDFLAMKLLTTNVEQTSA